MVGDETPVLTDDLIERAWRVNGTERFMIVVDGPSSVSGDRWLAGLNSPADGVVSIIAAPGSHAFWALASAIPGRLGQSEAAHGSTENDRRLLATWLEAYGIADVIVSHADHYPGPVLVELDEVLTELGVRLWLVIETALMEATVRGIKQPSGDPARLNWAAFEHAWRERSDTLGRPVAPTSVLVASEQRGLVPSRRVGGPSGVRMDRAPPRRALRDRQ